MGHRILRISAGLFLVVSVLQMPAVAQADQNRPATEIPPMMPVRGLELMAPAKKDLGTALDFIRGPLTREKINTLILEFDYHYNFQSHPEFSDASALGKTEVGQIAKACQAAGINLIPMLNCLGHQSWAAHNGRLLEKHPEFDETAGKFPENKGIYCRSYCPLHPGLHPLLFDLIEELAGACDAKDFHVGMDEVFILGDPDCPRCKEKSPADLFAGEANTLHDHLQKTGLRMWMWGDRFINGKETHIGKWEASENGTEAAISVVPKDIVICDWHYEKAYPTVRYFAEHGFDVVACPWRKTNVALEQLKQIEALKNEADAQVGVHAVGMVQTSWSSFDSFVNAYEKPAVETPASKNDNLAAAACFKALCKAIRGESR